MRRHGSDEAAWRNDTLPWEERVQALRLAMQERTLTSGVDRHCVPVVTYEDAERVLMAETTSNRDKLDVAMLNEVCHELNTLSGMLIGKGDQGGMLRDMQSDLRDIKRELGAMDQRHNEELAKLALRVDKNAHDIDSEHELRRELESGRIEPVERWINTQKRGWKAALGWFGKVLGSVAGGLLLVYLGARLFGGGG